MVLGGYTNRERAPQVLALHDAPIAWVIHKNIPPPHFKFISEIRRRRGGVIARGKALLTYLYTSFISPSVSQSVTLWENVIFIVASNDRQLKFSVKIPMTLAHVFYSV